jgi:hypothetical protein
LFKKTVEIINFGMKFSFKKFKNQHMKKTIAILAVLISSFSVIAQENPSPVSNADIKFEKTTHDYGTIKQNANGDCEFTFTNTGKDPLIISNCAGSCGCTVPSCPKEPILPGKTGSIKVHYDTKRVGPISKSVTVNSNAKSGTVMLQIKGTVEALPAEETFPAQKSNTGAPFEK